MLNKIREELFVSIICEICYLNILIKIISLRGEHDRSV